MADVFKGLEETLLAPSHFTYQRDTVTSKIMKSSAYLSIALTVALTGSSIAAAFPWIPNVADPSLANPIDTDMGALPLVDAMANVAEPLNVGLGADGPASVLSDTGLAAAGASPAASASSQVVQTPSVELDHQVLIQPETSVLPVSRLQPIINIARPIIHIDPFYGSLAGGFGGFGVLGNYGMNAGFGDVPYGYGDGGLLGYEALPTAEGPSFIGPTLMKRQLGGGPALGGPTGNAGASAGLATDTLIQPIVNIEAFSPLPVPVKNPIPYQYPVPYSVGTPFPVRTFSQFDGRF
ncbi:hypothetical protein BGZ73_006885 [Actinomortierella ambigua]|nr:hypothetical protein BGZ73_006885 [Actinomortierella ambigua]